LRKYFEDILFGKSTHKIKVEGNISQNSREITGFGAAAVISKCHQAIFTMKGNTLFQRFAR
jgi:hypothetical protein